MRRITVVVKIIPNMLLLPTISADSRLESLDMDAALLEVVSDAIRSVSKRTQTMVIQADSRLVEDLSLDSLDLVGILMKLEDHFGLIIEIEDVPNTKTVADLGNHVAKLRSGQATAA